jgi:hypothetical protein
MYQLYQNLKNRKTCFNYLGVFNDNLTDQIIQLSEHYLEHSHDLSKINKKVSFLIAECFQNVVRHGGAKERSQSAPGNSSAESPEDFYQINVLENGVNMTSCNLIPNSIISTIQQKIDSINALNPDELKKLYQEVLFKTGFSGKGGAGLGLIDMARKSGRPLQFFIHEVDTNMSRFFLSLEISASTSGKMEETELRTLNDMYARMRSENKLMVYSGEFSEDTVVPLTEMIRQNFDSSKKNRTQDKKILVTLIEILQNISVHGRKIENAADGVFSISKNGEHFEIESGNIISEKDFSSLSASFTDIDKMTVSEITPLYRKWLDSPDVHSGLGLMEIMRNSGKNYSYDFKKLPGENHFFTFKVTI